MNGSCADVNMCRCAEEMVKAFSDLFCCGLQCANEKQLPYKIMLVCMRGGADGVYEGRG